MWNDSCFVPPGTNYNNSMKQLNLFVVENKGKISISGERVVTF